jgi:hypothetical protein
MWWKERPFRSCICCRSEWQMIGDVIFRHVALSNISSEHFLCFIPYTYFSLSLIFPAVMAIEEPSKKSRPPACWRPPHNPDETAHRFCFLPNHFTANCGCDVGQQLVQEGCNMQTSYEWSFVSRNTNRQRFPRCICCSEDWNVILYWSATIGRTSVTVNWTVTGKIMNTRHGLHKRKGR